MSASVQYDTMNVVRGRSDPLGVSLLAAITLVVGVTLFVTLGAAGSPLKDPSPGVAFETESDGETLTFTHTHGSSVRAADLTVLLRRDGDGVERRIPLATVANGRLGAGDAITLRHGLDDGGMAIRLIHEPTNAVLVRVQRAVVDAPSRRR